MSGSDPRKNREPGAGRGRSSPFAGRSWDSPDAHAQSGGQVGPGQGARDSVERGADIQTAPPWASPLGAVLLIVLSLFVLLKDGLTPYRVGWKKLRWKKVFAVQAEVEIPVKRTEIQAGIDSQDPYAASPPKTKLGAEEMAKNKDLAWKAEQAKRDRAAIRSRVVKRRTVEPLIYQKVVSRGVLFSYDEKRFFVRVSYTYRFGKKVYTKYRQESGRSFATRKEAEAYLAGKFRHWPIKVWVNPANPSQATAFLEYDGWFWIKLGFVGLLAGLLWMLLSLNSTKKQAAS